MADESDAEGTLRSNVLTLKPVDEATIRARIHAWRIATGQQFALERILYHQTYLDIIGLGPLAVPFLLEELRDRPAPLFLALRSITGENPVRPGAKFQEAIEDWLSWGHKQGMI